MDARQDELRQAAQAAGTWTVQDETVMAAQQSLIEKSNKIVNMFRK
jgi:hypothetical protein